MRTPTPVSARALGAATAILADQILGEPPTQLHPVARFGSGMDRLEQIWWRDSRSAGVAYFAAGVAAATVSGTVLSFLTGRFARSMGIVIGCAVAGTIATAGRALGEEALKVRDTLRREDLSAARQAVRSLVGRDSETLSGADLIRAVVESVAENTVDAVVAPILWTVAGGVPFCFAYRATNTLDAMVGHRSARYMRFGWASARADDIANWVPARATAILVAAVRPRAAAQVWRAVSEGPGDHPSPNAGVVEAAFAGALGVQVGGDSTYDGRFESRPRLGSGRPPQVADIDRAVKLSRDVSLLLAVLLVAAAIAPRAVRAALVRDPK